MEIINNEIHQRSVASNTQLATSNMSYGEEAVEEREEEEENERITDSP